MKYIITDKGEVRTGTILHARLTETCEGKVIAAGHYNLNSSNKVVTHGRSEGYDIQSKPEDAVVIQKALDDKVIEDYGFGALERSIETI